MYQNDQNVHYCPKCGRRLNPGERCDCGGTSFQSNPYVEKSKSMFRAAWKEFRNILRHPATRVRDLTYNHDHSAGLGLILSKGIICAVVIFVLSLLFSDSVSSNVYNYTYGYVQAQTPLKEIFLLVIAILIGTIGIDLLESLFLKLFSGSPDYCAALNATGSKAIIDTLLFVIFVLFLYLAPEIGLIIFLLFSSLSTVYQLVGFISSSRSGMENKATFAYIGTKIVMAIITALLLYLFIRMGISAAISGTSSMFGL